MADFRIGDELAAADPQFEGLELTLCPPLAFLSFG
jgi:hypothetical protein